MNHQLTVTTAPVAELRTYHGNPRRGNLAAITESLVANGQFRPIVVNAGTHTGRAGEVLAGNHTLLAARDAGWDTIQIVTVDVDETQAARIVAADNRTADLGEYDDELLLELLQGMGDLTGSAYATQDMDDLAALLEEQRASLPTAGEAGTAYMPPPVERVEVDGTNTYRTHAERAEDYRERDVRAVYLTFTLPEFEWAVPRLEKLAAQYNVETNTETVLKLIANATGDPTP